MSKAFDLILTDDIIAAVRRFLNKYEVTLMVRAHYEEVHYVLTASDGTQKVLRTYRGTVQGDVAGPLVFLLVFHGFVLGLQALRRRKNDTALLMKFQDFDYSKVGSPPITVEVDLADIIFAISKFASIEASFFWGG